MVSDQKIAGSIGSGSIGISRRGSGKGNGSISGNPMISGRGNGSGAGQPLIQFPRSKRYRTVRQNTSGYVGNHLR